MPRIFAAALLAGTLAGAALAGGVVLAAGGFASRPGTEARSTRVRVAPAGVAGRPVRVPAGYRLRSIADTGARVAIPHGWFALGRSDAVFPGVIQTLTRVDHSLLPSLVGLTMAESPLKLFAFERHASDGSPATTLQVLVDEHGAPRALSPWSHSLRAAAARSPGLLGRPSVRPFDLPAGRALRVDYTRSVPAAGGSARLWTMQVVVASGNRTYALVFTAAAARRGLYEPVFRRAVRSLRIRP